jgi:hypothetical protein
LKQRAFEVTKKILIILALGFGYYLFNQLTGIGIPCPLHKITGLLCPGCGISRMCIALIQFDIKSAFYYNAAILCLIPIFALLIISYYYNYIKYDVRQFKRWQNALLLVCIITVAAFGILRNIFDLGLSPSLNEAFLQIFNGGK